MFTIDQIKAAHAKVKSGADQTTCKTSLNLA